MSATTYDKRLPYGLGNGIGCRTQNAVSGGVRLNPRRVQAEHDAQLRAEEYAERTAARRAARGPYSDARVVL